MRATCHPTPHPTLQDSPARQRQDSHAAAHACMLAHHGKRVCARAPVRAADRARSRGEIQACVQCSIAMCIDMHVLACSRLRAMVESDLHGVFPAPTTPALNTGTLHASSAFRHSNGSSNPWPICACLRLAWGGCGCCDADADAGAGAGVGASAGAGRWGSGARGGRAGVFDINAPWHEKLSQQSWVPHRGCHAGSCAHAHGWIVDALSNSRGLFNPWAHAQSTSALHIRLRVHVRVRVYLVSMSEEVLEH